ncbi:mavicyanin-like [Curcuma longa]|uniref:mavicyanin-like n=1 Tax=Curcuma longa TaxID=136217 RepID=UPI003D9F28D8
MHKSSWTPELMAAAAVLLIFVAVAVPAATATDYTVGGSQGWTSGVDYNSWASGKTFNVGDSLLFQYSSQHSVAEVGESDFNACSSSNSIQTYTDQSTRISLTEPGSRYFICGTPGHCSGGMKLEVSVAGSTTPSSPSSPSGTASPASGSSSGAPPSASSAGKVLLGGLVLVGLAGVVG